MLRSTDPDTRISKKRRHSTQTDGYGLPVCEFPYRLAIVYCDGCMPASILSSVTSSRLPVASDPKAHGWVSPFAHLCFSAPTPIGRFQCALCRSRCRRLSARTHRPGAVQAAACIPPRGNPATHPCCIGLNGVTETRTHAHKRPWWYKRRGVRGSGQHPTFTSHRSHQQPFLNHAVHRYCYHPRVYCSRAGYRH